MVGSDLLEEGEWDRFPPRASYYLGSDSGSYEPFSEFYGIGTLDLSFPGLVEEVGPLGGFGGFGSHVEPFSRGKGNLAGVGG